MIIIQSHCLTNQLKEETLCRSILPSHFKRMMAVFFLLLLLTGSRSQQPCPQATFPLSVEGSSTGKSWIGHIDYHSQSE